MKAKYNGDVELALRSSAGSFALEGLIVTEEEIETGRKILNGELDSKEHARAVIARYQRKCNKTIDTFY